MLPAGCGIRSLSPKAPSGPSGFKVGQDWDLEVVGYVCPGL